MRILIKIRMRCL